MPRSRLFTIGVLAAALMTPLAVPSAARAVAVPIKVAIIVGPTGADTAGNRAKADALAAAATALGATVSTVYSPHAIYSNVRAATDGANIIVFYGHGNGFPNPYNAGLLADRDNGFGLNTTTSHGDADSWSAGTLVYCGEKALEGKLTSTDGATQQRYCAGGGITPAPGFVMVYEGACYTAGGNEPQNPAATSAEALLHVAYFSRPILTALGGSGYFANHAQGVVADLLTHPDWSYGDIFDDNLPGYNPVSGPYDSAHALVPGAREWLTQQSSSPYWSYAFAGDPSKTFAGGTAGYTTPPAPIVDSTPPRITERSPWRSQVGVSIFTRLVIKFTEPVHNVTTSTITLWRGTTKVGVLVAYDPASMTATVTPLRRLVKGVRYTISVGSTIRDAASNRLVAMSWSFTTAR